MTLRASRGAGALYPRCAALLVGSVNDLMDDADREVTRPHPAGFETAKCVVVPHAGLVWSGPLAAPAYLRVSPCVRRVVILGPSHGDRQGILLSGVSGFETPLGPVTVLPPHWLLGLPGAHVDDRAHARETCIEAQLPFLQNQLAYLEVLPILVGDVEQSVLVRLLEAVWGGPETLVVITANLAASALGDGDATDDDSLRRVLASGPGQGADDGCGWRLLAALDELVDRRRLDGEVISRGAAVPGLGAVGSPSGGLAVVLTETGGKDARVA